MQYLDIKKNLNFIKKLPFVYVRYKNKYYLWLQVPRTSKGMYVLYIQGALYKLLHRDPRVPHRSGDSSGTLDGCQLPRLLKISTFRAL